MYKIRAMKHKDADMEALVRAGRNDDYLRVMS